MPLEGFRSGRGRRASSTLMGRALVGGGGAVRRCGGRGCSGEEPIPGLRARLRATTRNPRQEAAISVQFVPVMRIPV
eukprot:1425650-Rhodomonas_salina.3